MNKQELEHNPKALGFDSDDSCEIEETNIVRTTHLFII